jgi:cytochrome c553
MRNIHPLLSQAALALALVLAQGKALAGDAVAGKARAQACSTCHGAQGLAVAPDAPHLAGQPEIYLAAQLRAFRSGERRHEVMNLIAKPLTDDDIANLAAWFSSFRIDVVAKPAS